LGHSLRCSVAVSRRRSSSARRRSGLGIRGGRRACVKFAPGKLNCAMASLRPVCEPARSLRRLASESKCLAQSNKSGDGGAATKR
jgi:hypothetical protein